MKRFLRWFLDFLERKFPDQLVVNEKNYNALLDTLRQMSDKIKEQEEKMRAVEMNLLNINAAMGFAAPKMGMLER